ncbi:MAG: hypothetical protein HY775_10260 [Acidobacteria bacterium]|nr:hypothetical protein [Acidobacteriota bacterium]
MPDLKYLNRWREWLDAKGPLWIEVVDRLLMSRQVFRGFTKTVEAAPPRARANATFYKWATFNYLAWIAVTIRRVQEPGRDVVSLKRLLDEIATHPAGLPSGQAHLAKEAEADGKKLERDLERVTELATAAIAHNTLDPPDWLAAVNIRDLDKAIDDVVDVFVKYRTGIVGSSMATTVAMTAWEVVFDVAWRQGRSAED